MHPVLLVPQAYGSVTVRRAGQLASGLCVADVVILVILDLAAMVEVEGRAHVFEAQSRLVLKAQLLTCRQKVHGGAVASYLKVRRRR